MGGCAVSEFFTFRSLEPERFKHSVKVGELEEQSALFARGIPAAELCTDNGQHISIGRSILVLRKHPAESETLQCTFERQLMERRRRINLRLTGIRGLRIALLVQMRRIESDFEPRSSKPPIENRQVITFEIEFFAHDRQRQPLDKPLPCEPPDQQVLQSDEHCERHV